MSEYGKEKITPFTQKLRGESIIVNTRGRTTSSIHL